LKAELIGALQNMCQVEYDPIGADEGESGQYKNPAVE
jgi:hypothetical protein